MPGKLTEGVDEETKPKGEITQDPKPDVQPQDRLITSHNQILCIMAGRLIVISFCVLKCPNCL